MYTAHVTVYDCCSNTKLWFSTPKYRGPANTTSIDVKVQAKSALNIGPKVKSFSFEYRLDPILINIHPRKTIIR